MGDYIALMHSELSEAFEDFRDGHSPTAHFYRAKDGRMFDIQSLPGVEDGVPLKPCGIPSEMADVIIRVFDFCGAHGIDLERAVREKMMFNESRPYKHGKQI